MTAYQLRAVALDIALERFLQSAQCLTEDDILNGEKRLSRAYVEFEETVALALQKYEESAPWTDKDLRLSTED